ncbi:retinol-binding protein 5 isoform X3 [Chlorocebus sabaeus]|uniref:retinol-binding protein 5 isoform X3 n=1 Tax=Chlorocebus sabaeus TaxID=60711 RepID=UPI003BF96B5D
MPPNLTGYYRFVSQKNMEDYLQALNISLAVRKIALLLKPDKEIDHQGNHMTVRTLSTFRNYTVQFDVGVEFEEDLRSVDGRKCQHPRQPPTIPASQYSCPCDVSFHIVPGLSV